jgi:hypothetical protein
MSYYQFFNYAGFISQGSLVRHSAAKLKPG